VAPVEGGAEGLVPGGRVAATTGKKAEAVVEAGDDLLDGQRPGPGCGQLQSKGDPVEAAAELGHRARW
jgi:hypothetical protein